MNTDMWRTPDWNGYEKPSATPAVQEKTPLWKNALSVIGQTLAPEEWQAGQTRKQQNALAGAMSAGDYKGAANAAYQLGDIKGGLYLSQYEDQQAAAQAEKDKLASTESLQAALAFTQNLKEVPVEQRGQFAMDNWDKIGPMVAPGMDFMDFWKQSGGDVSDASLDEDIAALNMQLGVTPAGPGKPITLSEGSIAIDAQGNEIATNPKAVNPKYVQKEFRDGIYEGIEGQPDSWVKIGDSPVRSPVVTVNNSAEKGEDEFAKKRGASNAASIDEIYASGEAAMSTLADAQMMNTLLDQIDYTGFGGNTLMSVQRVANAVGVEIGDDLAPKEAATRLTSKLGLALKQDLPGPMSDGDRQFLLSIPPNINTTKEANKALVYMMTMRAQSELDMYQSLLRANPQTAEDYAAWENQYRLSAKPLFTVEDQRDLLRDLGM